MNHFCKITAFSVGLLLHYEANAQTNLTIDWATATVNAAETQYDISITDPNCAGSPVVVRLTLTGTGADDVGGSSGPVSAGTAIARLNTTLRFDSYAESLQYKIVFNKPVTNVKFKVFQVDRTVSTTSPANFQDQVTITSHTGNPTITAPMSAAANSPSISGNVITGATNITTTAANNAPDVNFGTSVLSNVSLDWRNGPDAGNFANYDGQTIGLGNISFTTTGCALPVNLVRVQAQPSQEGVEISWQTDGEQNSAYFQVQRGNDAQSFESIGNKIDAAGTTNDRKTYRFTDLTPLSGINYYRLKQTDFDGSHQFSKIISINLQAAADQLSVYPNPTADVVAIKNLAADQEAYLQIYSLAGLVVKEGFTSAGQMAVGGLPNGLYFVDFKVDGQTFKTKLLINK